MSYQNNKHVCSAGAFQAVARDSRSFENLLLQLALVESLTCSNKDDALLEATIAMIIITKSSVLPEESIDFFFFFYSIYSLVSNTRRFLSLMFRCTGLLFSLLLFLLLLFRMVFMELVLLLPCRKTPAAGFPGRLPLLWSCLYGPSISKDVSCPAVQLERL